MKRLGSGLMRLDFQAQARLFQCAVTPDVINPFVGQDDVFPFGCSALGLWNNMLHRTFVGLKNPLCVSATVIVALAKCLKVSRGRFNGTLSNWIAMITRGTRTTRDGVLIPSSCSLTGNSSQFCHRTGIKYPSSQKSKAVAASAAIIDSAFCTVMTLIGCQLRLRTRTCLSRLLIGKTIVCFFLAFQNSASSR